MPCQHAEDVCQYCLEKVQTTTEEPQKKTPPRTELQKKSTPGRTEPQKKSPRGRTIAEKRNNVLFGSIFIGLSGYIAFQSGKWLFELLDLNVKMAKDMLEAIMAPTRKE